MELNHSADGIQVEANAWPVCLLLELAGMLDQHEDVANVIGQS